MIDVHARLLAQALYEIRILLGGYLGSDTDADLAVRQAAHLAYALHNDALSVISGGTFDVAATLARLESVDAMLDSRFSVSFAETLGGAS